MNKLEMIRGAINFVVTLGVGNVVKDTLKKVRPEQTKGALEKLVTKVGGFAIGMYVTDKITDHVDQKWLKMTGQNKDSEVEKEITDEIIEDEA